MTRQARHSGRAIVAIQPVSIETEFIIEVTLRSWIEFLYDRVTAKRLVE